MREILFRGRRSYNQKWVYGNLIKDNNGDYAILEIDDVRRDGHHIGQESDKVMFFDNDTIGQYTGLTDKNGTKIFEGDLVKITERGMASVGVVEFINAYVGGWVIGDPTGKTNEKCSLSMRNNIEIIGNIHESEVENG